MRRMVVEPALKVALAVRVALTMDGLDGDVAQLAAEAAPGGNPIANVPALLLNDRLAALCGGGGAPADRTGACRAREDDGRGSAHAARHGRRRERPARLVCAVSV